MVEVEERAVLGPPVTRTRPPLLPQEEGGKRCQGGLEGGGLSEGEGRLAN